MSDTGDSGFSRREFVRVAASGLALTTVPGWVRADANGATADKTLVVAQIPTMHAANVKRLQEWIALPSIAAENRCMRSPSRPQRARDLRTAAVR
jgi:hypothetical protein